jgi:hypothetical protein
MVVPATLTGGEARRAARNGAASPSSVDQEER